MLAAAASVVKPRIERDDAVMSRQSQSRSTSFTDQTKKIDVKIATMCDDVAWDREEWEACQMNTTGCCIDHECAPKRGCECW